MAGDSEVAVAMLLPDVLGTYSDAANATVLVQRLRWRGIAARIVEVTASEVPPAGCELYVIGGGEDTAQHAAAQWLHRHPPLAATLAERAVTLAVCAGLQLLGHSTTDREGTCAPGLGLLDLSTRPGPARQVGEATARSPVAGVGELTGFHNHRGVSTLGPTATPLAHTLTGPSNHPEARLEGALTPPRSPAHPPASAGTAAATGTGGGTKTAAATEARVEPGAVMAPAPGVVATYMHGPVLARNPGLADYLLVRALGMAFPEVDPDRLPDLAALRRTYLTGRR